MEFKKINKITTEQLFEHYQNLVNNKGSCKYNKGISCDICKCWIEEKYKVCSPETAFLNASKKIEIIKAELLAEKLT